MTAEGGWVWMYGVAGHDLEAFADDVTGVGGAPPRTVTAAGLTSIVGDVGDRDYGGAALRRNLEDLDWLGQTARAHHAVLEAGAERGPVVPMRLATLFADDAGVTGTLQERADDFRGALSLISARSEWGVKAHAVKPADPADPAGEALVPAGVLGDRHARVGQDELLPIPVVGERIDAASGGEHEDRGGAVEREAGRRLGALVVALVLGVAQVPFERRARRLVHRAGDPHQQQQPVDQRDARVVEPGRTLPERGREPVAERHRHRRPGVPGAVRARAHVHG